MEIASRAPVPLLGDKKVRMKKVYKSPAERAEFCAREAVYAQDWIAATNSGGIEPPRNIVSISSTETDDDVYTVKVEYNYPEMCGCWHDCRYHVSDHKKVRSVSFHYHVKEDYMVRADVRPIFDREAVECFAEENRRIVDDFYDETGLNKEVGLCI